MPPFVTEHERSASVAAPADRLFDYLSDIQNLPRYFDSMTSAEPAGGDAVRTTANLNGQTVEGEAWFRVDDAARRIEWGSEGPNNYSGWLRVDDGEGGGSTVEVHVSTERVANGDVDDGLTQTLDNIKRVVEEQGAPA
jgi:uncharacterized membrane protein